MKFVFTDKRVNLPNKVHAYAEKKVGKLDRYFKADAEAAIVFSVEKDRNNVELTVRSGSTIIRVSESTSDMFATIDAAVSSVERQLRKNKARLEKRLRQGAFERSVDEEISTLCPTAGGGGVQPGPQQALSHQAHDPGRGHPSDESAGPQLLSVSQHGRRPDPAGLPPGKRHLWCADSRRLLNDQTTGGRSQ